MTWLKRTRRVGILFLINSAISLSVDHAAGSNTRTAFCLTQGEGIVMGFNKASTLLAAAMATSTQVAAQAACDPAAGLTFICGLTNAEDLVQVPGTPWIVAGGLAEGEPTEGHIYLVNAPDRAGPLLLP